MIIKNDIQVLVKSEGFSQALENKTIFFTPAGKEKLGLHSEVVTNTQDNALIAQN